MTITMQNYALTWTAPDGMPQASAISYDRPSAERQKEKLEASGNSNVQIVETRPGQLPEPKA